MLPCFGAEVSSLAIISVWVGAVMMDSDGAATSVLVSGEKVLQLGLQVIAKIKGYADAAQVL